MSLMSPSVTVSQLAKRYSMEAGAWIDGACRGIDAQVSIGRRLQTISMIPSRIIDVFPRINSQEKERIYPSSYLIYCLIALCPRKQVINCDTIEHGCDRCDTVTKVTEGNTDFSPFKNT